MYVAVVHNGITANFGDKAVNLLHEAVEWRRGGYGRIGGEAARRKRQK